MLVRKGDSMSLDAGAKKKRKRKKNTAAANPVKSKKRRMPPKPKKVRRVKRGRVKPPDSHRGLTMLFFFILSIYLIGYVFAFMTRPSIAVEAVSFGNIDTPTSLKGIIVRDEYVEKSSREGQPTYFYSAGERIKKDAVICALRDEQAAEAIEDKITKIDQSILDKQKKRSDLSLFQEDISRIEDNIKTTLDSFGGKFMQGDMSAVYNMKSQVDSSVNQRNEIWLAENVESASALSRERSRYESQLAANVSSYKAKASGILAFSYDDLETVLTPETIDKVTKEQVNMKVEVNQVAKAKNMGKDEPLFKLIQSNEWYIVSFLPVDFVAGWEEGDARILEVTVDGAVKELPVNVKSILTADTQSKVVFTATKDIEAFMDMRSLDYKMKKSASTGIKIPKNAVIEKTLLKIPADCVTQSLGETGVMKVVNGEGTFISLNITMFDASEGYYYVMQDLNTLKLGDIVLKGTGEEAVNYTLSEAESRPGVFVANSAVARFVMIDIIEENTAYAVVRPGSSTYELQAYDTIVSDAKNIEEGQMLY